MILFKKINLNDKCMTKRQRQDLLKTEVSGNRTV